MRRGLRGAEPSLKCGERHGKAHLLRLVRRGDDVRCPARLGGDPRNPGRADRSPRARPRLVSHDDLGGDFREPAPLRPRRPVLRGHRRTRRGPAHHGTCHEWARGGAFPRHLHAPGLAAHVPLGPSRRDRYGHGGHGSRDGRRHALVFSPARARSGSVDRQHGDRPAPLPSVPRADRAGRRLASRRSGRGHGSGRRGGCSARLGARVSSRGRTSAVRSRRGRCSGRAAPGKPGHARGSDADARGALARFLAPRRDLLRLRGEHERPHRDAPHSGMHGSRDPGGPSGGAPRHHGHLRSLRDDDVRVAHRIAGTADASCSPTTGCAGCPSSSSPMLS